MYNGAYKWDVNVFIATLEEISCVKLSQTSLEWIPLTVLKELHSLGASMIFLTFNIKQNKSSRPTYS